MNFRDKYTTEELKTKVNAEVAKKEDEENTQIRKDKENKKTIVSNEAFLISELIDNLTKRIRLTKW